MTVRFFAGMCFAVFALHSRGKTIEGVVVCVPDGDFLTILDAMDFQHRIRINGIDASEKRQPFARRTREIS